MLNLLQNRVEIISYCWNYLSSKMDRVEVLGSMMNYLDTDKPSDRTVVMLRGDPLSPCPWKDIIFGYTPPHDAGGTPWFPSCYSPRNSTTLPGAFTKSHPGCARDGGLRPRAQRVWFRLRTFSVSMRCYNQYRRRRNCGLSCC